MHSKQSKVQKIIIYIVGKYLICEFFSTRTNVYFRISINFKFDIGKVTIMTYRITSPKNSDLRKVRY